MANTIAFPSTAFRKDLLTEANKAFGSVAGILQALSECQVAIIIDSSISFL